MPRPVDHTTPSAKDLADARWILQQIDVIVLVAYYLKTRDQWPLLAALDAAKATLDCAEHETRAELDFRDERTDDDE
jgi:hypothetical protein